MQTQKVISKRKRKQPERYSPEPQAQYPSTNSSTGRRVRKTVLENQIVAIVNRLDPIDDTLRKVLTACNEEMIKIKSESPTNHNDYIYCEINGTTINMADAIPPPIKGQGLQNQLVDAYANFVMENIRRNAYWTTKIIYFPIELGNKIKNFNDTMDADEVRRVLESYQITGSSVNVLIMSPFVSTAGNRLSLICVQIDNIKNGKIVIYDYLCVKHEVEYRSYQSFFSDYFGAVSFTRSDILLQSRTTPGPECSNTFICLMLDLISRGISQKEKLDPFITSKNMSSVADHVWTFMHGFIHKRG